MSYRAWASGIGHFDGFSLLSNPNFRPFWGKFTFQTQDYQLSHLDQFDHKYQFSAERTVTIRVIFGHHCFSRGKHPGDHPDLDYTLHPKDERSFCFIRHSLSLNLPGVIPHIMGGKVSMADGTNYVRITLQQVGGQSYNYAVFFSLDRTNDSGADLIMRIRSAYDQASGVSTYGEVRFKNLVELALKGKRPKKIFRR